MKRHILLALAGLFVSQTLHAGEIAERAKARLIAALEDKPEELAQPAIPKQSTVVTRGVAPVVAGGTRGPRPDLPSRVTGEPSVPATVAPKRVQFEEKAIEFEPRKTVDFSDIFFRRGQAEYLDEDSRERARGAIEGIRELMKRHHNWRFYIVGHTCDLGPDKDNDQLSWRRAYRVLGEFGANDPLIERISALGSGERLAPARVGDNAQTEILRGPYRKVQFAVVKDGD